MMKSYRALLLVGVVLAFCPSIYAATIQVPADQPTIQAGINAAVNRDTMLVAPVSPQGEVSVLFSDDFNSGLNPLWTKKGDCTWDVIGGQAHTSLTGYYIGCYLIAHNNATWTDYTFECDVRGNAGVVKEVLFRYNGNQAYGFCIRSDWITGDEAFLNVPGHEYAQIVNFPSQNGVWYHIEITCQGNHIVIKVDGATVIDYVDASNSCPSGGIGLSSYTGAAGACDVRFDNVVVKSTSQNRPPTLTDPGSRTINEDATLAFTLVASDPDSDRLTYSATPLPSGAVFNTSNGSFSWKPSFEQAGIYSVTFAVSDGKASAQKTIQITVINVNRPPVLVNPGNRTVDENSVLAFTLSASDPDLDSLTYSASSVPLGAAFNAAQHSFVWQPTYEQTGAYSVTFSVSDGLASDQETITITVNNVNRPPSQFVLKSPHDRDTVRAATVNLYWASSIDPDAGDTAKYQLQYSVNDSTSWQHSLSSITDTTYTLPALEELKTYYWKVTARDKNGGLTECSGGRFRFFAADATPPSFTIDVLSNPVLLDELDIYAYPSEPLNALAQAKITSNAGTVSNPMTLLADRLLTGYVLDYQIGQSGQYTISICGNDLSNNLGCTDQGFSAARIYQLDGGQLASPSGAFKIAVPAHSISSDGILICTEKDFSMPSSSDLTLPETVVPLRTIQLKGSLPSFSKHALLSIDPRKLEGYEPNKGQLLLFQLTDEGLKPIATRFDLTAGESTGEISGTGTYILGVAALGSRDVSDVAVLPVSFRLDQNSPNPFNGVTKIAFNVVASVRAHVDVFNILGQSVVTLLDDDVLPGNYAVSWDGKDQLGRECSSGVYMYRFTAGTFTETKRMLYLK